MGARKSETVGGYVRQKDVLVMEIDSKRGVWECSSRFCDDVNGWGPLEGPPIDWVARWWDHIREKHTESEWS